MGRPAIPLAIHKLHGTENRSVHARPSAAMTTAGNLPPQPKGLDATARAMWRHVTATRAAWLAESDAPELQSLCETWSLRCAAFKAAQADPTDKLARCAFTSYQAAFDRLAARFGLTPADRAKLGEVDALDDDPASEFVR